MERRDSVGFPHLYTELVRRGGGGRRAGVWRRGGRERRGKEPSRGWPNEGEGVRVCGARSAARKYWWTGGSLGPRQNMREMYMGRVLRIFY